MAWTARTTDDGIETQHQTVAEARKAANQRTGRILGAAWGRTLLDDAGHSAWEKAEDGELFAVVFRSEERALVHDTFGFCDDE